MNKPHCPSCRNIYRGADDKLRCRINGLLASPANAEDCRYFERDPGSNDERMVWFEGAWCVDRDRD